MRSYVTAFLIAAGVAAALTPIVRRLALHHGAVGETGGRNVHVRPTPRLGGVAICLAILVPIVGLLFVESGVAVAFKANARLVVGLAIGSLTMCAVGAADDLRGVRALTKLTAQVAVATLAFGCGFRIQNVFLPLLGEISMGVFALPVTVIWFVGVVNAVNLIDGLDGLAAGVAFFAGITNLLVAYIGGGVIAALVMSAMLGAIAGFLVYNFNPARIFMGDSGSYLLGFVLAATPLVGPFHKASSAVALLVPVVALGVPIFDTMFTIVRRFLERRPIFSPDRGHVHHRLLDLGITHRRAVLLLYGVSVVFTAAAIAIHLGRSWQVGVALLAVTTVSVGLARFAGYFSLVTRRGLAQTRVREVELFRRVVPDALTQMAQAKTEAELLNVLEQFASRTELAAMSVVLNEMEHTSWEFSGSAGREVAGRLRYPIGADACARAHLVVGMDVESEHEVNSQQVDILLQLVADQVAVNAARVDSEFAPVAPAADTKSSEIAAMPLVSSSGTPGA